ncbi:unnamed protein product [Moneuplotes crassus]|uniref:Uncharacterized protein n=1 Tax=Euplotes crassus TaxID=5936 RepID=A0AAD1UNE7_EUPCR|nr:unnamed protein product [Moneuplotes crassus]
MNVFTKNRMKYDVNYNKRRFGKPEDDKKWRSQSINVSRQNKHLSSPLKLIAPNLHRVSVNQHRKKKAKKVHTIQNLQNPTSSNQNPSLKKPIDTEFKNKANESISYLCRKRLLEFDPKIFIKDSKIKAIDAKLEIDKIKKKIEDLRRNKSNNGIKRSEIIESQFRMSQQLKDRYRDIIRIKDNKLLEESLNDMEDYEYDISPTPSPRKPSKHHSLTKAKTFTHNYSKIRPIIKKTLANFHINDSLVKAKEGRSKIIIKLEKYIIKDSQRNHKFADPFVKEESLPDSFSQYKYNKHIGQKEVYTPIGVNPISEGFARTIKPRRATPGLVSSLFRRSKHPIH